jgi:ssDNA-binding Zn-finger/Zn-ribbon topoisomerase 1
MIIESKFNFGDKVYPISQTTEQVWVPCDACNETGVIILKNNEEHSCPVCCGNKGRSEWKNKKWMLLDNYPKEIKQQYVARGQWLNIPLTIGKIDAECLPKEIKIHYMCKETGIGSGSNWYETELFASRDEAQTECDRRNSVQL